LATEFDVNVNVDVAKASAIKVTDDFEHGECLIVRTFFSIGIEFEIKVQAE